jgi:hypothetical protein
LTALVVVFVAFLAACVIGFFVGFVGLAALFEKFFAAFFVAVVVFELFELFVCLFVVDAVINVVPAHAVVLRLRHHVPTSSHSIDARQRLRILISFRAPSVKSGTHR